MNAARWIPAREGRKHWWSALTHFRGDRKTQREPSAPPVKAPLVLVGTFHDVRQFEQASVVFRSTDFLSNEVELVTLAPAASRTWRERVRQYVISCLRGRSPHFTNGHMRGCAGMVIVRTAACFGRACQIIEQYGGEVGFPAPPRLR